MRITDKRTMYRMLAEGRFGNTVPAFPDLTSWLAREPRWAAPAWGVRSLVSGDPRMRLNLPTEAVVEYCRTAFGADPYTISPMVDPWLTWRAEIFDSPTGLACRHVVGRPELPWRRAFAECGETLARPGARFWLRAFLNPNSHDDLMDLFDHYPGHVVELTALGRCYGTVPHRNAIVWEVRDGESGRYEFSSGWAVL
jgi:hypothetical protein